MSEWKKVNERGREREETVSSRAAVIRVDLF